MFFVRHGPAALMLTTCANTMTVQHHDRMEMQAGRLAKRGRGDDRVADSVVAFGALGGRIKSGEAPALQQGTGFLGTAHPSWYLR